MTARISSFVGFSLNTSRSASALEITISSINIQIIAGSNRFRRYVNIFLHISSPICIVRLSFGKYVESVFLIRGTEQRRIGFHVLQGRVVRRFALVSHHARQFPRPALEQAKLQQTCVLRLAQHAHALVRHEVNN